MATKCRLFRFCPLLPFSNSLRRLCSAAAKMCCTIAVEFYECMGSIATSVPFVKAMDWDRLKFSALSIMGCLSVVQRSKDFAQGPSLAVSVALLVCMRCYTRLNR